MIGSLLDGGVESGQSPTDLQRLGIEQMTVALGPVGVDPEGVPSEPGEDVQVEVENFLERGLAVGEEYVDAFAAQARTAQSAGDTVSDPPNMSADILVQVLKARRVQPRYDEDVSRSHGIQVHEGHRTLVGENDAGLGFTCDDGAEDTLFLYLFVHLAEIVTTTG